MTVRFRVTGRVQGVGFRAHVRYSAEKAGLVGEVWNTSDGAVEGWADGAPEDVRTFALALNAGPGRVDSVEMTDAPPRSADGFTVGPTR